ncbi:Predicted PurR-regulated permease PerM [Persephonella hydrogeniphila]|uniref:Predicted PurR-regulated permease PerM n=1 Tax=Persephonella hydrogeniphila TaxID=198703 RepID=A0A285NGI4_9AQUI|nr:AI-2E family transporter [Persephonella hydrogeniphila]SNZ06751.1 Predicted PurR-regulated permease PerM [Persephonella hydrogeniphila]
MDRYKISIILVSLASIVVIIAGLKAAQDIVVQFLLALFFAVMFLPIFKFFVSKKIPKWLSLIFVLFINLAFIYLLSLTVITSVNELRDNLSEYQQKLNIYINESYKILKLLGISIPENISLDILNPNVILQFLSNSLLSFGNILANALFIIILVVFILLESDIFAEKLKVISKGKKAKALVDEFFESVIEYMKIKTVMSALTGFMAWIFLFILGVDFSLLWGILAFLLNYIPTIGSIIAAVPPVIIALIDGGIGYAIAVSVWYLAINMVIGNILEPKFMGKGVGLSPLVVLLSLVFWGWVLGTVGMFLSIPLTIIAKMAFELRDETRWIAVLMDNEVRKE